jgi:nitrate/nitrite-specific signal transduction histidine kinase
MKLISEREKDWEDARRLLRRFRASVDRAYLEPRLTEMAEALARPGIIDLFRRKIQA